MTSITQQVQDIDTKISVLEIEISQDEDKIKDFESGRVTHWTGDVLDELEDITPKLLKEAQDRVQWNRFTIGVYQKHKGRILTGAAL